LLWLILAKKTGAHRRERRARFRARAPLRALVVVI